MSFNNESTQMALNVQILQLLRHDTIR